MVQAVSLLLPDVLEYAPDEHDLPHLGKLEPEVGRPRNKQKNFRSEPKQTETRFLFGCVSVCFLKPKTKSFGLFRCFEPISKQPKQTELFRNKPKQP